jgi:hypothetical protein
LRDYNRKNVKEHKKKRKGTFLALFFFPHIQRFLTA